MTRLPRGCSAIWQARCRTATKRCRLPRWVRNWGSRNIGCDVLSNGALGHRNFAQFVNGYRLAEVRSALADPAQREVPIITIALDAGFGSLGPFNRAFRDVEGVTPREWRVARMVDSEIG